MPAHEEVSYNYRNGETRKALSIWTLYGNDSFIILYHAEPGYSNQYFPHAKRMINSFQIIRSNDNDDDNDTFTNVLQAQQEVDPSFYILDKPK
jgi:hypothetical protein